MTRAKTSEANLVNLHAAIDRHCPVCLGHGLVCNAHPEFAWGPGLPSGYFAVERVCWCSAGPRLCPCVAEDEDDHPRSLGSHVLEMLWWALGAAAITLVFGIVLNVMEAWL